jgi:hypothetical protein
VATKPNLNGVEQTGHGKREFQAEEIPLHQTWGKKKNLKCPAICKESTMSEVEQKR